MEYQKTILYSYASGRVKYVCKHPELGASTARSDWFAWKYTDADLPNSEGPRIATGGVDAEAALNALSWSI